MTALTTTGFGRRGLGGGHPVTRLPISQSGSRTPPGLEPAGDGAVLVPDRVALERVTRPTDAETAPPVRLTARPAVS